jgi:predicted anti-sigma-YlaC factor YlaD
MRTGQIPSTDCDRMRAYVSAGIDSELSEVESAWLEGHLGRCASCRAYAVDAGQMTRVLRDAPLEELDFAITLPSRRLAFARKLQVAAAAAAIAATVGLSAVVGTVGPGGTTSLSKEAASFRPQSASLRFPENELKMLYRASSARSSLRVHGRLAL